MTIYGHFDRLAGRHVAGWVCDRDDMARRVPVRVLVDGVERGRCIADQYRPDLQDAGIHDGAHAFTLVLPDAVMDGGTHNLLLEADGTPILGTPIDLLLPSLSYSPLSSDAPAPPIDLAICAIAKDEAPYLLEWLAYHRVVGVEHFLIFDNGSSDGTTQMLERLSSQGWLEHVAWPTQPDRTPQEPAYTEGLKRLDGKSFWAALIDLDEFLLPLVEDDVRDILRGYRGAAGLMVPWRIYGSGGQKQAGNDLVMRRFTRRATDAHPVNATVKSILRPHYVSKTGVHTSRLTEGYLVDEHFTVGGVHGDPDRHVVPNARRLVLNHYFCKSWEEWERKRDRGIATALPGSPTHIRPDNHFHIHDVNELEDRSILRFEAKVLVELERLRALVR